MSKKKSIVNRGNSIIKRKTVRQTPFYQKKALFNAAKIFQRVRRFGDIVISAGESMRGLDRTSYYASQCLSYNGMAYLPFDTAKVSFQRNCLGFNDRTYTKVTVMNFEDFLEHLTPNKNLSEFMKTSGQEVMRRFITENLELSPNASPTSVSIVSAPITTMYLDPENPGEPIPNPTPDDIPHLKEVSLQMVIDTFAFEQLCKQAQAHGHSFDITTISENDLTVSLRYINTGVEQALKSPSDCKMENRCFQASYREFMDMYESDDFNNYCKLLKRGMPRHSYPQLEMMVVDDEETNAKGDTTEKDMEFEEGEIDLLVDEIYNTTQPSQHPVPEQSQQPQP